MVKLLLESGANVNLLMHSTPLHDACRDSGWLEGVHILLSHGADPFLYHGHTRLYPISGLRSSSRGSQAITILEEILKVLVVLDIISIFKIRF